MKQHIVIFFFVFFLYSKGDEGACIFSGVADTVFLDRFNNEPSTTSNPFCEGPTTCASCPVR